MFKKEVEKYVRKVFLQEILVSPLTARKAGMLSRLLPSFVGYQKPVETPDHPLVTTMLSILDHLPVSAESILLRCYGEIIIRNSTLPDDMQETVDPSFQKVWNKITSQLSLDPNKTYTGPEIDIFRKSLIGKLPNTKYLWLSTSLPYIGTDPTENVLHVIQDMLVSGTNIDLELNALGKLYLATGQAFSIAQLSQVGLTLNQLDKTLQTDLLKMLTAECELVKKAKVAVHPAEKHIPPVTPAVLQLPGKHISPVASVPLPLVGKYILPVLELFEKKAQGNWEIQKKLQKRIGELMNGHEDVDREDHDSGTFITSKEVVGEQCLDAKRVYLSGFIQYQDAAVQRWCSSELIKQEEQLLTDIANDSIAGWKIRKELQKLGRNSTANADAIKEQKTLLEANVIKMRHSINSYMSSKQETFVGILGRLLNELPIIGEPGEKAALLGTLKTMELTTKPIKPPFPLVITPEKPPLPEGPITDADIEQAIFSAQMNKR